MKRLTAIFTAFAICAAAHAQEGPKILSLEDCIEITLKNNPAISSSYASTEAQRNRLWQTRAGWLPQINANAGYSRSDSESELIADWIGVNDSYSSSISASQLLFDFGKTGLGADIQKNSYYAAQQDTLNTVNTIIYQLKQAYYGVLAAVEQRDVYKESVEQYREQLKRAQAFFDVGTRPKIDVTTAQVNLNTAQLNLISAANALNVSVHRLMNIMGVYMQRPNFRLHKESEVTEEYAITFEDALAYALENRPDLAGTRLRLDTARQNVKLAAAGFAPEFSASGSYGWSGGGFPLNDRWSVGAGVSLPIFSGFSTVNKIKETKNSVNAAYYNLTEAQQNVLLDVRTAYFNLQEARERIPVADVSRQAAQENYNLAVGRYTVGVGNYIEVKDAEVSLSNARLQYISAVFDYNLAVADLKRSMGTK